MSHYLYFSSKNGIDLEVETKDFDFNIILQITYHPPFIPAKIQEIGSKKDLYLKKSQGVPSVIFPILGHFSTFPQILISYIFGLEEHKSSSISLE